MLKIITILVPATTTTVNKLFCDDCGEHAFTRCKECAADICVRHRHIHPEDSGSDFTDYICESCLTILGLYLPEMEELEDRLDALEDDRKLVCQQKRKAKNNEINKTVI